jgi:DNA repair protein RadD
MQLRPYQIDSFDAIIKWVKKSFDPCIVNLSTGAGKSLIIAAVAEALHSISGGKKILCLAPSKELVLQNREKYLATGNPASVFSASAGGRCLKHPVVFGTEGTVKNALDKFGNQFCAVIIDEAHRITPTIKNIIEQLQQKNPKLRVIGLTATPYRMGTGYIYQIDENGRTLDESEAINPFFTKLLYKIDARFLIEQGYLTPPVFEQGESESYDTSGLTLNRMGQFDSASIDKAFVGKGRKTSLIVAEIVEKAQHRMGAMIFAATVQHAQEIMESLPPDLSAIVTGETKQHERAEILARFKAMEIKYLVNVAVLTTGFDAPHVDLVAILRATESASLLQQIIGRGLRMHEHKQNCLVMDFAGNIDRHCPSGDVFEPQIKTTKQSDSGAMQCGCPMCGYINEFKSRPNPDKFEVSEDGYFLALDGIPVESDHGPIPAHHGRRCNGFVLRAGKHAQCSYYWTSKECPECQHKNDIAARYCSACKAEIINPNEKLKIDFQKIKSDPHIPTSDKLLNCTLTPWTSAKGNKTIKASFTTEYRTFPAWFSPSMKGWSAFCDAFFGVKVEDIESAYHMIYSGSFVHPSTITAGKIPNENFYKIYAFNQDEEVQP